MANNIKAQIATVNLGHVQIEGLLGADSKFYVAVSQIAEHFQFAKSHASRDLKALLSNDSPLAKSYASEGVKALPGNDLPFLKARTNLNSKAVNVVTLDQFHQIVVQLGIRGNVLAQEVLLDMSALGMHQLFCDAFGVVNDAADRAAFLQARMESKSLFWELTGQIKVWLDGRECSAPPFTYYANAFDCLNLQLFGKRSKIIREELGIEAPSGLNRDHFGVVALRNIGIVQSGAARMMAKESVAPSDAIKHIAAVNYIEVADYRV